MEKEIKKHVRYVVDAGTTYTKILYENGETDVIPTRYLPKDFSPEYATGHNARRFTDNYYNELIALAEGGLSLVDDEDFTIVDVGSRDIKFVRLHNRSYDTMDWNDSCGALAGFTIELLEKYFDMDPHNIEITGKEKMVPVVCGVLGMASMFDRISHGDTPEEAYVGFLWGLINTVHHFINPKGKIYLSGGLCEHPLFVRIWEEKYNIEIVPLGRYVLCKGLLSLMNKEEKGIV